MKISDISVHFSKDKVFPAQNKTFQSGAHRVIVARIFDFWSVSKCPGWVRVNYPQYIEDITWRREDRVRNSSWR